MDQGVPSWAVSDLFLMGNSKVDLLVRPDRFRVSVGYE